MKFNLLIFFFALTLLACKSSQKTVQQHEITREAFVKEKFAKLLEVQPNEINTISLYSFINEWLGVRYEYGGTSKNGVDCSGFCNMLYLNVYQKQLPRTTSEIAKEIRKVSISKLEEGDILVFDIDGKKSAHVGIYLQNNKFIHASTSSGVVISNLDSPYYKKAFNKGGRI